VKFSGLKKCFPSWQSAGLAVLSAVILILAFPGWELWFTAFFAFIPVLVAIDGEKASGIRSLVTGWIFGSVFFFGTCWWLTFSPITYAGFPWLLAYFLLLCVCLMVGLFPALFALVLSVLLRRLGAFAVWAAPCIWIASEFLRFWVTGNNWNALAYSQAFEGSLKSYASYGGIYLVGAAIMFWQTLAAFAIVRNQEEIGGKKNAPVHLVIWTALLGWFPLLDKRMRATAKEIDAEGGLSQRMALLYIVILFAGVIALPLAFAILMPEAPSTASSPRSALPNGTSIVAIQPNVPMEGLNLARYEDLKRKHIALAENAFEKNVSMMVEESASKYPAPEFNRESLTKGLREYFQKQPKIVIFPESPMNFMYEDDKEFQEWVRNFAVKNNASVLFNAAEPDPANKKYFNSAVMVDEAGKKVGQYDKIYLVPFGETVPAPLQSIIPALVGSFSYGKEYDLLPFGDAKGGIMICFESHFPNLSREYVQQGADVLIEMTNDGYLGPTPILRQHLANAVFRAVETARPVVRVTNVGISAYINERGDVLEPTAGYTEDTRVWGVGKSNQGQTLYVRFGDWFAWLSSFVSIGLLVWSLAKKRGVKLEEN